MTRPDSALVYDLEQQLLESLHTKVLGPLQVLPGFTFPRIHSIPIRQLHMGTKLGSVQLGITASCTSQSTRTGETGEKWSCLSFKNEMLIRRTLEVLGLAGFSKELAPESL